jgi:FkbM family methyltransferase
MKKVFLDCGTHFGQGLAEISKLLEINDQWQVHSWEANPYTFQELDKSKYPSNYYFYNAAITDYSGTVDLNVESINDSDTGQGTSIVEIERWKSPNHKGSFVKTVEVQALDLSDWIANHCKDCDFVAIKLDIEGAEYAVLEKMIREGTIDLVDQLFIEWHARFFPDKEIYWEKENQIIKILRNKNIKIVRWK